MPRRNINQHRGRTAIVELLFAFYVDAGGGEGGTRCGRDGRDGGGGGGVEGEGDQVWKSHKA